METPGPFDTAQGFLYFNLAFSLDPPRSCKPALEGNVLVTSAASSHQT